MRDILPEKVFEAIAQHLRSRGGRAHRHWSPLQTNEDSLTGATFADLRTPRPRRVPVGGRWWRWRVAPAKFGSGGKGSAERQTGADGIVEIEVVRDDTGDVLRKGVLVQAKKLWSSRNAKLKAQVEDMEAIAPGCSAVINYTPAGYSGVPAASVLDAEADRGAVRAEDDLALGDFLADRFLPCRSGVRGLYYEANRRLLHIPVAAGGAPRLLRFTTRERLRIEVRQEPSPNKGRG